LATSSSAMPRYDDPFETSGDADASAVVARMMRAPVHELSAQ
jgi:hypothetical protein